MPPAQQTWAASSAPSLLNLLPFGAAQAPPAFRPLQARGRHHSTCLSTHTTSSPIPSLIFCSRSIWGSGRWGEVRVVYMCQSSASNQRGDASHPPGSTQSRCCPCSAPFPSGTPFPLSGLTSKGPTCDSLLWSLRSAQPVQGKLEMLRD